MTLDRFYHYYFVCRCVSSLFNRERIFVYRFTFYSTFVCQVSFHGLQNSKRINGLHSRGNCRERVKHGFKRIDLSIRIVSNSGA